MKLSKLFVFNVIVLSAAAVFAADGNDLAIIPAPQKVQRGDGVFSLTAQTQIYTDSGSRGTAEQLAGELRPATGFPLVVKTKWFSSAPVAGAILLTTKNASTNLGTEGYELTVTSNTVVIRAATQAGLFYGAQTLLQLLPTEIFSSNTVANVNWQMPCVEIMDWPRFPWRGLMLDVSRHFYTPDEVKKVLDLMALHKLNTFHWHLVDDQGWRIEIKKYPKLTEVGAWRKQSDIMRPIAATNAHPAWAEPASTKFGADGRYGGFYTQDQIRDVVAYAAARHIKIVPEIEMPGHSMAALTAYPQFSCFGGPYNTDNDLAIHTGIYDPSKEGTFNFLDDVLTEVFGLFPDKYIHIGGDEVQKRYWHRSADCQALMKREGLKNEEELQSWFIKRIEKFVNAHGKTMIGWSEILQGGLATNAVVMDWIGGGQEAASAGHDVVMSPEAYCYLDHYQSTNHPVEPRAIGGYTPLEKIYLFDPVPTNLVAEYQSHVLGAQGNLWTEYVASLPHVEYMVFPRMTALAEVDWSAKEARNWDDFVRRLKIHEKRLDDLDVNYRPGTDEPLNVASIYHTTHLTTDTIDVRISLDYPGFEGVGLDSLGKEQFPMVAMEAPAKPWRPTQVRRDHMRVEYRKPGAADSAPPRWAIQVATNEIWLESHWTADDPPEPVELNASNTVCHVTLLGRMQADGSIQFPALMHFPDQGSFRISADPAPTGNALGYAAQYDGKVVHITFPPATAENPVVKYRWEVTAIHPEAADLESDTRFDGFRRDWLNIFQLSPHWHTLANHSASDTCAFCYYEYADIAAQTPTLAGGLQAMDMVRQTLDQIIGGANAYGMPGHGAFPEYSSDTLPSLLIAAEDYVQVTKDNAWLAANFEHLKTWADKMLSTDKNGDGLVKYTLSGNSGSWPAQIKFRPANWWDTIGFGNEDAYANALAYRALRGMAALAQQVNHADDQARYEAAADKLKAAYFNAFYDPATGVLAGWRSEDGQLHDYYFLWVNGIAIHYGLVPTDKANDIMDRLLAKMKDAGYTRFDLGLPGNLIPVLKKDYVDHNPRFGGGVKDDNTDGFQIYENGGATGCFAYFTLAALYDLGRIKDGDQILMPMLDSFDKGDFQGRGTNGMSKDWRTWDGTCWGYEGLLTDNYYALLAVMDRETALRR